MNLHETAMGQRFFNVQLPALINTLKDIAAALSRPAPSAISFPADPRFLTSLYYGEYEADVFKPDKRLTPFNQTVQQKEALPGNLPENGTDCWPARALRLSTPMCISTAATSGADSRPEATHGGCLWNEMNYAPL